MKKQFFLTALFSLALAGVTSAFAQTSTAPAPTDAPKWQHDGASVLTDAEKAQLKRAHDQVLATNPELKTEEDGLAQQRGTFKDKGDSATLGDKKALHAQFHAHLQKMHDAMLKFDPTLEPVFAKLKAAHQDHAHFSKA